MKIIDAWDCSCQILRDIHEVVEGQHNHTTSSTENYQNFLQHHHLSFSCYMKLRATQLGSHTQHLKRILIDQGIEFDCGCRKRTCQVCSRQTRSYQLTLTVFHLLSGSLHLGWTNARDFNIKHNMLIIDNENIWYVRQFYYSSYIYFDVQL